MEEVPLGTGIVLVAGAFAWGVLATQAADRLLDRLLALWRVRHASNVELDVVGAAASRMALEGQRIMLMVLEERTRRRRAAEAAATPPGVVVRPPGSVCFSGFTVGCDLPSGHDGPHLREHEVRR